MDNRQTNIAIQKTLSQIGMPHHLKGYHLVVSAVEKCVSNRGKLNCMVKGLYMEIAKENNETVSRVERAIRHAIEVSWKRGNADVFLHLFGYTVDSEKGRPTNSEFISYLCDFIVLYGEEIANGKYSF